MPSRGIQHLPIRYPRDAPAWFTGWMDSFIKEVLINVDVRNAIPGPGIEIDGNSDVQATISSSEDIQQLKDQSYVVADTPDTVIPNARILAGEDMVVEIDDAGPGHNITVKITAHGLSYSKLRLGAPLTLVGNPDNAAAELAGIAAAANDTVLRRTSDLLSFGQLTVGMAPDDLWTYAKLQNVSAASKLLGRGSAGGAGDPEEITLGTGLSMSGTTLNASLSGGSLATEILADSPTGYWKCDDTSGTTLVDSSGHGFDLTLTGTFTLAASALVPSTPSASYIKFGTGATSFGKRAANLGLSPPVTGDVTIEAITMAADSAASTAFIFGMMGVGETLATNFQPSLFSLTEPQTFWENGAGTNVSVNSGVTGIARERPHHHVAVKDSTAKTVTFFTDGRFASVKTYATEVNGGTTTDTYLGGNPTDGGCGSIVGQVAFYNGIKLSAARVVVHARAAGLFGA